MVSKYHRSLWIARHRPGLWSEFKTAAGEPTRAELQRAEEAYRRTTEGRAEAERQWNADQERKRQAREVARRLEALIRERQRRG